MYFYFNTEKIHKDFPILNSEVDCIVDFFSLDLVKDIEFNQALYALQTEAYHRLFEFTFAGKISFGNILPYTRCSPMIMHIPIKLHYKDNIEGSIIRNGLIKLSENYSNFGINTIGIQETSQITKALIEEHIHDLNLPNIIFYPNIPIELRKAEMLSKKNKSSKKIPPFTPATNSVVNTELNKPEQEKLINQEKNEELTQIIVSQNSMEDSVEEADLPKDKINSKIIKGEDNATN